MFFVSTKSNDKQVVKRKRARRNTSRFSHPFSLSFSNKPGAQMVGFKGSCWQHLTDDATDADATAFLPRRHSSFGMGGDWEKMDETDQMLGGTKRNVRGEDPVVWKEGG